MTNSVMLFFLSLNCMASHVNAQADSNTIHKNDPGIEYAVTPSIGLSSYPGKKWGFITNVPRDMLHIAKSPFQQKNLKGMVLVATTTAVLVWQDKPVLAGIKTFSQDIHLHAETDFKPILQVGNTQIIKVPQNLNTALYQVGEGGTSMLIAGVLFIYGKIKHDPRALQTAADITETFISMGIVTQLLKRSTGRESPSEPGHTGNWHPFPSFKAYQQHTPRYDAFPSGHLATMMATVTVVSLNYPEKKWIKPVGYTIMALSCFAMMNGEVHWAADYPLAFALGYVSGKVTASRHHSHRSPEPGF